MYGNFGRLVHTYVERLEGISETSLWSTNPWNLLITAEENSSLGYSRASQNSKSGHSRAPSFHSRTSWLVWPKQPSCTIHTSHGYQLISALHLVIFSGAHTESRNSAAGERGNSFRSLGWNITVEWILKCLTLCMHVCKWHKFYIHICIILPN
jgi:hypothetical protein